MTNTTFSRTITADLPDSANKTIKIGLLTTVAISSNGEISPRDNFNISLDGNGVGSVDAPCPDGTGDLAYLYSYELPDIARGVFSLSYAANSIDLSDLIASSSTSLDFDAITALVEGKATKQPLATQNNIATFDVNGDIQDGGSAIADLGNVSGPSSVTDKTVARFSGTTGKIIDETVTNQPILADDGNLSVDELTVGLSGTTWTMFINGTILIFSRAGSGKFSMRSSPDGVQLDGDSGKYSWGASLTSSPRTALAEEQSGIARVEEANNNLGEIRAKQFYSQKFTTVNATPQAFDNFTSVKTMSFSYSIELSDTNVKSGHANVNDAGNVDIYNAAGEIYQVQVSSGIPRVTRTSGTTTAGITITVNTFI